MPRVRSPVQVGDARRASARAVLPRGSFAKWENDDLFPTEAATLALLTSLPPGSRVLDFGCSTGRLLDRLGPRYERYGIEVNEPAAKIAAGRGITILDGKQVLGTGPSLELDAVVLRRCLRAPRGADRAPSRALPPLGARRHPRRLHGQRRRARRPSRPRQPLVPPVGRPLHHGDPRPRPLPRASARDAPRTVARGVHYAFDLRTYTATTRGVRLRGLSSRAGAMAAPTPSPPPQGREGRGVGDAPAVLADARPRHRRVASRMTRSSR